MQKEEKLIEGCKNGDRKSQQFLYELHSKRMFFICQRYSKSLQEAEDILQESFIKVFKNIHQFRSEASFFSWMKRIVVNTALNHQRSKLYLFPMVDVEEADLRQDDNVVLGDYHFNELLDMVRELPSGCQIVFNLYALEGYNHREIADMLKISEGTSKSQYSRAKSLLKGKICKAETVTYGRV